MAVEPEISGGIAEQSLTVAANVHYAITQRGILALHIDARITVVQHLQRGVFHREADAGKRMTASVAVHLNGAVLDHPVA